MPDLGLDSEHKKKTFVFTGKTDINAPKENFFLSTISLVLMYSLWECKLQKTVPSPEKLANDVFFTVENIRRVSAKLRNDMNLNLLICRCWRAETSRRE
jgi:hypothetical protein